MKHIYGNVEAWVETTVIPTYEVGKADKNPMFLEKRVYQGSSGRVYPYPVIDKILDEKVDKKYQAVYLENDYIKVMILPELGGRIQRAYDKTNDYDFVYYNHVIKPALVGLTGPWISGGIEFNWPQHHRPTTYSPVDYVIESNDDGSKTVMVSEVDQMYGTKGMASFTLYPDKSYIEIKGQLYNRTSLPQTFLWWANPAVAVNDHTQSVFPPDVNAVFDHGKRDVSKFPIATGTYYKHDYSAGIDISRYKNLPVPTSYMAYHSDYNFVGGYDYQKQAGILHIADHHVSPGKKQWTWGCGDFGQAWDRNLTDEDGPYIELMTGMFTDNQPDFTWLAPYEEKTFTQYFMPYKKVGYVTDANKDIIISINEKDNEIMLCVYASAKYENAKIILKNEGSILLDQEATVSPIDIFEKTIKTSVHAYQLSLSVYDKNGNQLINVCPKKPELKPIPNPAEALPEPKMLQSCEELYLAGKHLEQYRHATYIPDDYYLEGLKRDDGDIRLNNAYGELLLRRGLFEKAEMHFRKAIHRSTWKNPNPQDSGPYFNLGLSLVYQNNENEAYDAFYKSVWTSQQQEMGYYWLAAISCRRQDWETALYEIKKSLVKNSHNIKARVLLSQILLKLNCEEDAKEQLIANIKLDPFDYCSRIILDDLLCKDHSETIALIGNRISTYIECAIDFAECGFYQNAIDILERCPSQSPMINYYKAYYLSRTGQYSPTVLKEAANCCSDYCFPNRLEDIIVLNYAIENNHSDAKALYYLGCLRYDKRCYNEAQTLWEKSAEIDGTFPTVWRNLSLIYFNKLQNKEKAKAVLEKAFYLNNQDARILLELDQLYKKMAVSPSARLQFFDKHWDVVQKRDDLYNEYISILNALAQYEKAYELICKRKFHPWEGGEGKVTKQYVYALTGMARNAINNMQYDMAISLLNKALVFPYNLGEGKLEGQKDNDIYYLLGLAYQKNGDFQKSTDAFEKATIGSLEPASVWYYNDQPADMILYNGLARNQLKDHNGALKCFNKLINYGETHLFDDIKIDYFAVSLPELQLYEEDLNKRNQIHCYYLMGLGNMGLNNLSEAKEYFNKVLEMDPSHQGATIIMHIVNL